MSIICAFFNVTTVNQFPEWMRVRASESETGTGRWREKEDRGEKASSDSIEFITLTWLSLTVVHKLSRWF